MASDNIVACMSNNFGSNNDFGAVQGSNYGQPGGDAYGGGPYGASNGPANPFSQGNTGVPGQQGQQPFSDSNQQSYGAYSQQPMQPQQGPYMQSQAGYAGYGNVSYQNAPRQLDAMDVIGQGFKGFFRNWAPWTGAITVHFIILLVVMVVPMLIGGALAAGSASTGSSYDYYGDSSYDGASAGMGAAAVLSVVLGVIIGLVYSCWMIGNIQCAASKEADGQRATFGDFFKSKNAFAVAGHSLVATLVVSAASLLFVIPGIIAAFLLYFVPYIKADNPQMSVGETFRASYELTKNNIGQSLLCIVICGLLVGILFYIPAVGFGFAYGVQSMVLLLFYRYATGKPAVRWA